MKTVAIILGILSVISLAVWARALFFMIKIKKPEVRKIDSEHLEKVSTSSITGFSKEIRYERRKGIESTYSEGMSYSDLAEGIKQRDPNALLFIQIFAGFGIGLLSGVAAIGSAVVAYGNSDGYFMIGFSVFFSSLFTGIIIDQKIKSGRNPG